jgi:hypothetical protein
VTLAELVKVVAELRRAQKAYFKHRGHDDLIESKRLEKLIDAMIEEELRKAR